MRNFRSLVLGLVLVSLAGVSWGDCVEGNCSTGERKYVMEGFHGGTTKDRGSSILASANLAATKSYVELVCSGAEDNRRVIYTTEKDYWGNSKTRRKVKGEIENHSRIGVFREEAPAFLLMAGTKCSIEKNLKKGWDTPTDFAISANMIEGTFKQRIWCGGNNKVSINRLTGIFTSDRLGKDLPLTCKLKETERRF